MLLRKKDRTKRFGTTEHISLKPLELDRGYYESPLCVGGYDVQDVCVSYFFPVSREIGSRRGGGLERRAGGELEGREGKKREEMAFQRLMEK